MDTQPAAPQHPVGTPSLQLPRARCSPGRAWALSLLVPGVGQLYCRKWKRGVVTLTFFMLACAGVGWAADSTSPAASMAMGTALRIALALYAFAGLDAYFTAQEINSGRDARMACNPRVAAVLNFCTRAFGYFYAGDSKKGWLFFLLIGALNQAARKSADTDAGMTMALLGELVSAALAMDGYWTAQRRNRDAFPDAPPAELPWTSSLPRSVPLGFAASVGLAYAALTAWEFLAPDPSVVSQYGATVEERDGAVIYRNPTHDVEITLPAGWTLEQQKHVLVSGTKDGCEMHVWQEPAALWRTLDGGAEEVASAVTRHEPGWRLASTRPVEIGGREGRDLSFSDGSEDGSAQFHLLLVQGLGVRTRIEMITTGPDLSACEEARNTVMRESRL